MFYIVFHVQLAVNEMDWLCKLLDLMKMSGHYINLHLHQVKKMSAFCYSCLSFIFNCSPPVSFSAAALCQLRYTQNTQVSLQVLLRGLHLSPIPSTNRTPQVAFPPHVPANSEDKSHAVLSLHSVSNSSWLSSLLSPTPPH